MSSMQHLGKGIIRTAKNYTKGYSDVQAKVRDATSNDPWGPSGTQMNELAQLSYNQCVPPSSNTRGATLTFKPEITSWRLWRCWTND